MRCAATKGIRALVNQIALPNDLPFLAITYDNTPGNPQARSWNLPELLTVSGALGTSGVVATFVLFFMLKQVGLSQDVIRSLLFLRLVVAGRSMLQMTRTPGWFRSRPHPAPVLLAATFGTEIIATLIAVYGPLIRPIGWAWALAIWAYALIKLLINHGVKQWACRLLRPDLGLGLGGGALRGCCVVLGAGCPRISPASRSPARGTRPGRPRC